MDARTRVTISKKLSYHLRHAPENLGISLDQNGWADVDELLDKLHTKYNIRLSFAELEDLVEHNDKKRFAFDSSLAKIRANQGHSVDVDLELEVREPPAILYHGTVRRFLGSIMREGLKPMSRQFVHLSASLDTAMRVGSRRGPPVVLQVDTGRMHQSGVEFRCSLNGVWLVSHVPAEYITVKS